MIAHRTSVLVIFEHPLLGEGLAARLRALGVHEVVTARSGDRDEVARALHHHPDVVVVESTSEGCVDRVTLLSPGSRVVDATASVGRGCPAEAMGFDSIVDALRGDAPSVTPVWRRPLSGGVS